MEASDCHQLAHVDSHYGYHEEYKILIIEEHAGIYSAGRTWFWHTLITVNGAVCFSDARQSCRHWTDSPYFCQSQLVCVGDMVCEYNKIWCKVPLQLLCSSRWRVTVSVGTSTCPSVWFISYSDIKNKELQSVRSFPTYFTLVRRCTHWLVFI